MPEVSSLGDREDNGGDVRNSHREVGAPRLPREGAGSVILDILSLR